MFDSDSILLTNCKGLIKGAERNYETFKVPTKLIESPIKKNPYTSEAQTDLDIKTSVNKIGEIINLSQELNSKLWDLLNSGGDAELAEEMYNDVSQLDIMSNLEIDSAKRINPADNVKELKKLRDKYTDRDDLGRYIKPLFFMYLEKYKGYYDSDRIAYQPHKTTMDFLQKHISKFRQPRKSSKENYVEFVDILKPPTDKEEIVQYWNVSRAVQLVRDTRTAIAEMWSKSNKLSNTEKFRCTVEIKRKCAEEVGRLPINSYTMYYLLCMISQKKYTDISTTLFAILFSTPSKAFWDFVNKSKEPLPTLIESDDGELKLYGFTFTKKW